MEKNSITKTSFSKRSGKKRKLADRNIFKYDQFNNNSVLHAACTKDNVLLLLNNGNCISWGSSSATLGRRLKNAAADSFLPKRISISIKIIDIACGMRHCLARGVNYVVYSWGYNTHGQLGLPGVPVEQGSEMDEPVEIQTFLKIKIKQISAAGNSSFAISDGGNNTYAWGENKQGQLGLNFKTEIVKTPKLVDLTEKFNNEIVIAQNKKGNKSYLAELTRPASDLSNAMIFFKNKQLYFKELALQEEMHRLTILEEQLKKRTGILGVIASKKDMDRMLGDIKRLRDVFERKKVKNEDKCLIKSDNADKMKSYDEMIEYQKQLEEETLQEMRNLENARNEADLQDGKKKEFLIKRSKLKDKKGKIIEIGKLLEGVSTDLHHKKKLTFGDYLLEKEVETKSKQNMLRFKRYVDTIDHVTEKSSELMNKKTEKEVVKSIFDANKKMNHYMELLKKNMIEGYRELSPDSISISDAIQKAADNMGELSDNFYHESYEKSSDVIASLYQMFGELLLLAKQNNIILDKFLGFSKLYYNSSLESKISYKITISEARRRVEEYKKQSVVETTEYDEE